MQLPGFAPLTERFPAAALTCAGNFKINVSGEPAERLSIGCETLDRDY